MAVDAQERRQAKLRETVAQCLWESLQQVCGGSLTTRMGEAHDLRDSCRTQIAFPNKDALAGGGKPHDMEVRLALSLFHRWRQQQQQRHNGVVTVTITSDMGLQRQVASPAELATLLIPPLETSLRREGVAHDVQCHPSGLIGIVTTERSHILRQNGKLPCPRCPKWCHGTKGLWWHQQQCHSVEHSEAASVASSCTDTLAIIPYNPLQKFVHTTSFLGNSPKEDSNQSISPDYDDPLEMIKHCNLEGLRKAVEHGYQPAHHLDHRGASPFLWAAGSGNLDVVRYLMEECACDPNQPQKGKRSFSGRTALHWAARKGHLSVVQYLVRDCRVNVEAATVDGTTAFGWASWQGHGTIMEFLATQQQQEQQGGGCDIHRTNAFGCNAVLWCAQGERGDVDIMKWLLAKGCHMTQVNHNGHGVLHKAAQRGNDAVCKWFWDTIIATQAHKGVGDDDILAVLPLLGPDTEGYCPSDLAGMEGHEELARALVKWEMDWIKTNMDILLQRSSTSLPPWLAKVPEGISMRPSSDKELFIWEPLGGVRRMKSMLVKIR